MKVLTITPNDLRVYDGTTVRVSGLTKSIALHVGRVYLASPSINDDLLELSNLVWIKLKLLRPLTLLVVNYLSIISRHVLDSLASSFIPIVEELRDVDVIHAHWFLTLPLAVGLRRRLGEIPIVVDLHGLFELQSHNLLASPKDSLFINLSRIIEKTRMTDKLISAFTVPSEPLKRYIVSRYHLRSDSVFTVPDGIDLDDVPDYDKSLVDKLRSNLGLEGRSVITYVGTPSYSHGFYDLLEAFNKARQREDLALLLVVPNKAHASNAINRMGLRIKNVVILENIPRREVYHYLYASNVLAVPHRAGTQYDLLSSNKLLDYMSSGKPIVSYALPSVIRVLKDYPLKVLVEPNSPDKLAEGILRALKFYGNSKIEGRKYVKDYDWKIIGKKLSHFLKSVG
ncbi:MAG: glycosyltransferase [Candidatus Bathyarchaeia archaeon]